jgi:uncharacterized SAM-binding protein YcdF (DUF218 family)
MKLISEIWTVASEIWKALPFQVKTILFAIVGVILLLAVVFGQIGACRSRREEKKIANIQANVKTDQVEANVLTNQKVEVQTNANNANADAQRVFSTDSGTRDDSFSSVRRKWCTDHPDDSKCK